MRAVALLVLAVGGVAILGAAGTQPAGATLPGETKMTNGSAEFVVETVGRLGAGPGTQAAAGEPITVGGRVRNAGNQTGTQVVRVLVDGRVVANETVTLAPGETERVTASVVPTTDGRYGSLTVTVETADESRSQSISIETAPTPTATETATETRASTTERRATTRTVTESASGGEAMPGFGPVLGFVAVLVVLTLHRRRSGDK